MEQTDRNIVKKAVYRRSDDANKGMLGSLLMICGCYGMAGAAVMAGKASLRCGIGLLKCAVVKSIYSIMASQLYESVFFPLNQTADGKLSKSNIEFLLTEASRSSAVLIGCGLSVCDDTKQIVDDFIKNCETPIVLDADGLNCIAENPDVLKNKRSEIIITPHPGEMARLVGTNAQEINRNRVKTAVDFSENYGVVTVLKGAGTIIASPDGRVLINRTGNSGMATGGSGDVLAGMTAALLAQGANPCDSAAAAVYLHGLAGDIAAEKFGKISMLPTDLIDEISTAYRKCGF